MVSSDNNLPEQVQRLKNSLQTRRDGLWGILAGAAGQPEEVNNLLHCLSYAEVDRAARGAESAPSRLREMVEALAVVSLPELIRLVQGWRRPSEFGNHHWWISVWHVALRHCIGHIKLDPPEFSESAIGSEAGILAREASLIWPQGEKETSSWDSLIADYNSGPFVDYDKIRVWGTYGLLDNIITETQIEKAPLILLRVLRGRFDLISPNAFDYLRNKCLTIFNKNQFEAALLVEALQYIDPSFTATLIPLLINYLPTVNDPYKAMDLCYILLNTGWTVP